MSRLGLLLFLLGAGNVAGLKASSVICQTGSNVSSVVATPCGQTFVANELMNWGAPTGAGGLGEAYISRTGLSQPVSVMAQSLGGPNPAELIGVTSNMILERADNTAYAWDSATSSWETPTFIEIGSNPFLPINTFAGHFNAPSYESSTAPYGPNNYPYWFGDPLLGAVARSSGGSSAADMTMTFSQALYGVSFEVGSSSRSDFVATLYAYGASGNLLGVYVVNTNGTGVGGVCSGLSTLSPDPVPCNNAPVIQFDDPEGRIKSVVLTVNDTGGLFIDSMLLDVFGGSDPTSTPEPATAPLIGIGLIVLALAAKRTSHWWCPKEV